MPKVRAWLLGAIVNPQTPPFFCFNQRSCCIHMGISCGPCVHLLQLWPHIGRQLLYVCWSSSCGSMSSISLKGKKISKNFNGIALLVILSYAHTFIWHGLVSLYFNLGEPSLYMNHGFIGWRFLSGKRQLNLWVVLPRSGREEKAQLRKGSPPLCAKFKGAIQICQTTT